jgi:ATP/maltotriose-dependent transcriptional regulator MalT
MAASGMNNREIAQALFVTRRTVEIHLTHSYQKLDIPIPHRTPRRPRPPQRRLTTATARPRIPDASHDAETARRLSAPLAPGRILGTR